MVYVANYACGKPFETYRKISTITARVFGRADKVLQYREADIPISYREDHKDIFSYKRGAGLWLWKPWVIYDALHRINEGDWLFYGDAGVTYIGDLHEIIKCATINNQDVFLFEQPLLSRQFTKRECYVRLNITDNNENQVLGLLLLKKTQRSMAFVEEWLHLCEREELISPKHFYPEIEEWPDYYEHREDQSLLNLLRLKYRIPAFRDCSDYGEMPYMYANEKYSYHPSYYNNSPYKTIILCNRKEHPFKYWIKYLIKKIARKTGLFYTEAKELKKRIGEGGSL